MSSACAVNYRHTVKGGHLTCPACWQLVPLDLRDELVDAQRDGVPQIELLSIKARVISSVRERLERSGLS